MRDGRRTLAVCAALAVGTLLLYAPVLCFDFITWDDPLYVVNNFHLQRAPGWHGLAWCFTSYGGNWIPMVWLSYMLDYQFHALNPAGYHATNVLLHAANAMLLFLVLKRMTGAFWRSAMVAALFAWHATHVESVAWIAERKDVLSTFFWMLTLWAYLNFAGKGGLGRYFLILMFFILGLMAKPMLVTLPFVLLLLDWWPLRRFQSKTPAGEMKPEGLACAVKTGRQLVLEKIPLFLLAGGFSTLTALIQSRFGATTALSFLHLMPRLENALVSYCRYIKKTIWPANLSIMYPLHIAWPAVDIAVAILFLVAITDVAIRFRKKFPYLMVGWLWYLGTLVPVIGLVQVGAQGMADRYTYIPSIGLFIMGCWGVFDLAQSWVRDHEILRSHEQWISGGLCLATLVLCSVATGRQLQYWRDGGTLFARALAVDPNNYSALNTYGLYLCDHGSMPEALVHLRKAVQINPKGSTGHATLGYALYAAGQRDEAAAELRASLKIQPDLASSYYELGCISLDKNLPGEAMAELSTALHYEPDNPLTLCMMGKALGMQGRLEEAQARLLEALRQYPQYAEAHFQLARTLVMQHKTTEAIAEYRTALRLQPAMPEALNNLAWILATNLHAEIRNGAEAVQLAGRACALTRDSQPVLIGTLAAAYAEAGQFDEAVAAAQKAHDLAVAQGLDEVAAKNAKLLELFRSRRAYHE
ncbi:MAG: tetratricopeptide repeat protein [Limisphaerales bacterium]